MIPKRLQKGDTIGVVAPSQLYRDKYKKELKSAEEEVQKMGYKVMFGKNFYKVDKYGVSAGSPQERADDVNSFFADPNTTMIWCSHGGDTANQVLEYLDFDLIKRKPKIFMGLSDNTVLLNSIYSQAGLITFHGTDFKAGSKGKWFSAEFTKSEFRKVFIEGEIGEVGRIRKRGCVRSGKAIGRIIGGNLPALMKMAGTKYLPENKGAILVIEGRDTTIKDAIFKLTQIKQMGIFENLAGIVVGYIYSFDKEKQFDRDGKRVYFEDIVLDITKHYDFPILKIYEFGHRCPSTFLPIGGEAEIDAEKLMFKITKKCVD